MKTVIYRIPTQDPYAYVEIHEEVESGQSIDPKSLYGAYRGLFEAFKGRPGLPEAEYRQFIDNQLSGKGLDVNQYEKMNDYQIFAVQVLKRAKKRN